MMPPDDLSTTFAALADPTRRAILARLAAGEASVSELAEPFDMSLPAISKHLKVLERAGLIARSRAAQRRPCRLEAARLKDVADWVERYRRFWDESLDRSRPIWASCKGKDADHGREPLTPPHPGRARADHHAACSTRREASSSRSGREPEHMVRWLGPKGFTAPSCEIDLRPGGAWRACIRSPEGTDHRMQGVYREIAPPERLVFTFAWEKRRASPATRRW